MELFLQLVQEGYKPVIGSVFFMIRIVIKNKVSGLRKHTMIRNLYMP